ncbi:hypothetical protein J5N97_027361 [Dioscorea zingiberensis]|uniref:DUF1995 domain-containing protein n=1 Tax=Dioscorea zingiberensis TaxID=325984 RepID=A0A9D5C4Q2_9LILI|nr:hypothetical protein J5N97_027361 [Dioscorea zingiberensis]
MGLLSWLTGKKEPAPSGKGEARGKSVAAEVPGLNGAVEVPRPAEVTVFEFGSAVASGDRVTLAGSSLTPPSSRQEAILQAKTSLSTTLHKPLNNPLPLPSKKLKKQRQPRYRVEIPILDNSPDSLVQLSLDLLLDLPLTRKGAKPTILILWPSSNLADSANIAFNSTGVSNHVIIHSDFVSLTSMALNTADIVVFAATETSQLEDMRRITSAVDPKPVVLFNPAWAFDDEKEFSGGGLATFIGSFDVVYSFMGLEVKGLLSRRQGVVFRCVKDGVVSGEEWVVMVEEEKGGELKVVSRFKRRPGIAEVESVMYNLMAASSPVTKSVKFLRDLASSVTGKKKAKQ